MFKPKTRSLRYDLKSVLLLVIHNQYTKFIYLHLFTELFRKKFSSLRQNTQLTSIHACDLNVTNS